MHRTHDTAANERQIKARRAGLNQHYVDSERQSAREHTARHMNQKGSWHCLSGE